MAVDFQRVMRCWEEMKAARLMREPEWQLIADFFMPRKTMSATKLMPGELRKRRVTTGVGQTALKRSAALMTAYMVDTSRPFIKPNVDRGMAAAGRRLDLDDKSRDYLENVEWALFDRMMLPQGGFLAAMARTMNELVGFGTGVLWTGRKRGFGPRYQSRPLRACWIAENADGEIDTLYFAYTLAAWRVLEQFPEAAKVEKLKKLGSDPKTCNQPVELLHIVEPRKGGEYGANADRKPFVEATIAWEHKAVLAEGGYNSFPYSVPRLNVEEGSVYGTGLAWDALPDCIVLNSLQASIERGVELKIEPPLIAPQRMFGQPLDRRPGALSYYDQVGLGFQTAKDALQKLDIAGDVTVADAYMQRLVSNIEKAFYVDWMNLRENGNVTAEEIRERRDLRLKAMSSIVPAVDRDLIGRCGDRSLECMLEENMLPPPTPELAGVEVDWDYAGPLALAQQQGQAEAFLRVLAAGAQALAIDPSSTLVLDLAEGLRAAGEAWGAPTALLRSRADVAAGREKMAAEAEQKQQLEGAAAGATALRDAGQGAASLAAADQLQQGLPLAA